MKKSNIGFFCLLVGVAMLLCSCGGGGGGGGVVTVSFVVSSDRGLPNPAVGTHSYAINSSVTVNCGTTPFSGGIGIQYVCTGHLGTGSLTDGAETSVTFTITENSTVTWLWQTQYRLTVSSAYGDPQGAGWYNEGVSANWSVTSPWSGGTGIQYVATPPTSGSVVMNSPQTVTVTWTTQYYLTVNSVYGDPQGAGWYNGGVTANWSVTSPVSGDPGVRYVASPASGNILMDAPRTVDVNWTTQYYLTVTSPRGNPQGEGWYNAGATANWSVTSPVSGDTGIRYVADLASGSVVMDSPQTVTVVWTTQYELTTTVSPVGTGTIARLPDATWYNSGAVVQLTATPGNGYVFINWTGDLSGTTNPQNLTMDAPKSVTANFALALDADFSATPTSGNVPLTVVFTDTSIGSVTSWSWNFGSGASPATANTQGPHSVIYSTEGLKTVSLTVTGAAGSNTETKVDYINVLPPPPTADFSASPRSSAGWTGTSPDFPLTVQFTDESTGSVTSWQWDFTNDGTIDSTERNPSFTYSTAGRYAVRLVATGSGGSGTTTKTDYIRVINSANTIYVRTGGLDTNDGLTWANAKKTIQAGITAASNDWAVLVAKGTYSTAGNYNLDFAGKTVHLKGVTAGGAYDFGTIWRIDGSNVSGRRGFIFQTGETAHTVVDNLEIYRGNAGTEEGGGINAYAASPTIINCTIWVCRGVDGGGIYCENGSHLTITNCTIKSNQATDGDGGGICCLSSNPRITGCTIGDVGTGNSATNNGGGLYLLNSSARVTNCTFDSNSTTWWGGAIYGSGSTPRITTCQILSNTASDQGGGIYLVTNCNALITGCTIAGNTTNWFGAGIYTEASTPTITGCTIGGDSAGNIAGGGGGGIYCWNSSPNIINCVIRDNSGALFAGGIECDNASSPAVTNCLIANNSTTADPASGDGNGAGLDVYGNSNPTFANCTIADNVASRSGGGIYASVSSPVLNNTILWGNSAVVEGNQIYTWKTGTAVCNVTLNYSDYANNTVNPNNIAGSGTVTANNCIVSVPLFAGAGDYHLQVTSPCINAGSNALVPAGITTDLDGNPRVAGSAVDMGAYEYQP